MPKDSATTHTPHNVSRRFPHFISAPLSLGVLSPHILRPTGHPQQRRLPLKPIEPAGDSGPRGVTGRDGTATASAHATGGTTSRIPVERLTTRRRLRIEVRTPVALDAEHVAPRARQREAYRPAHSKKRTTVAVARELACFVWEIAHNPIERFRHHVEVGVAAGAAPNGIRDRATRTSPGWRARF